MTSLVYHIPLEEKRVNCKLLRGKVFGFSGDAPQPGGKRDWPEGWGRALPRGNAGPRGSGKRETGRRRKICQNVHRGLTSVPNCVTVFWTTEQDKGSAQENGGRSKPACRRSNTLRRPALGRGLCVDVTLEKLDHSGAAHMTPGLRSSLPVRFFVRFSGTWTVPARPESAAVCQTE